MARTDGQGTGGDDEALKLATDTVLGFLKGQTYPEAVQDTIKAVSREAQAWWTSHYIKSFYFALTVKKLPPGQIKDDGPVLEALAKVLGRAARTLAEEDGVTEISEQHAWKASRIIDCHAIESVAPGSPRSPRAEWCN